MKTVEITRHKAVAAAGSEAIKPPGTWAVFMDIYRREGIKGINKGVNAVAVRQMTNWGSRWVFTFGFVLRLRGGVGVLSASRDHCDWD